MEILDYSELTCLNQMISSKSLDLLAHAMPFLFKNKGLETKTITITKNIIVRKIKADWQYD